MIHILRCKACGKYSLKEDCLCGGKATLIIPPKFSPLDKYAEYRRKIKMAEWKEKGLV